MTRGLSQSIDPNCSLLFSSPIDLDPIDMTTDDGSILIRSSDHNSTI